MYEKMVNSHFGAEAKALVELDPYFFNFLRDEIDEVIGDEEIPENQENHDELIPKLYEQV